MVTKSLPEDRSKTGKGRLPRLFRRGDGKPSGQGDTDSGSISDSGDSGPESLEALGKENAALRAENEELRQAIAELQRLSDMDPLLLILNRRAFLRECQRLQQYVKRHGLKASICYFDVDDLSTINNAFGHGVGDLALKRVAQCVIARVRGSDIFGRLGGDEFGLLLVEADLQEADRKLSELKQDIQGQPLRDPASGKAVALSITFGAEPLDPLEDVERILNRADASFYRNKRLYNRLFRR